MTTAALAAFSLVFLLLGYFLYGRFIERRVVQPDDSRPVPAVAQRDGVDYEPAHPAMLFGHHFSTIAGAGPIIGPILGLAWFGWGPVVLWILIGSVFLGGVHDYLSLMMSARNRGLSAAEITRDVVSPRAATVFGIFLWAALVLVICVFGVTAAKALMPLTEAQRAAGGFDIGPRIVFPTFMVMVIAMGLGVAHYKLKAPLWAATLMAIVLLLASIYVGYRFLPVSLASIVSAPQAQLRLWFVILMGYCLVASVLPVWLLLQPRDYLSMFVLFACLVVGVASLFLGNQPIEADFFRGFTSPAGAPLWPMLFVVVACGAISGFHSVAATGTSVKQLPRETLGKPIGYGAMLVEALLAVVAACAVGAGLSWHDTSNLAMHAPTILANKSGGGPLVAFAKGYGNLVTQSFPFISTALASLVGLTMLKTFVLTTLDSSTRLARFIVSETIGQSWPILSNRAVATVVTIVPAFALGWSGAWQKIWPVFGAANQLVAALALLTVTCWLLGTRKPSWVSLGPGIFMLVTTIAALGWQAYGFLTHHNEAGAWAPNWVLGGAAAVLVVVALEVAVEAALRARSIIESAGEAEMVEAPTAEE
ncbi:MAG: carbon starvation protein A [Armatimonadetes bacterium]|nr:carbon starvation protein A [Armatimonadota bacterium]